MCLWGEEAQRQVRLLMHSLFGFDGFVSAHDATAIDDQWQRDLLSIVKRKKFNQSSNHHLPVDDRSSRAKQSWIWERVRRRGRADRHITFTACTCMTLGCSLLVHLHFPLCSMKPIKTRKYLCCMHFARYPSNEGLHLCFFFWCLG